MGDESVISRIKSDLWHRELKTTNLMVISSWQFERLRSGGTILYLPAGASIQFIPTTFTSVSIEETAYVVIVTLVSIINRRVKTILLS